MSEIKDGGPAFPVCTGPYEDGSGYGHWEGSDKWQFGGVTMRDYFAVRAMQGMLANPQQDYAPLTQSSQDAVVSSAYGIADAMIAARSQP